MATKKLRSILTGNEVDNILNAFKSGLNSNNIKPKHIILFGSYAKNKAHVDSDIDVAVVVKESDKSLVQSKKRDLMYLASKTHLKLEPHFMTEKDYNNKYLSLPVEIKKYGLAS